MQNERAQLAAAHRTNGEDSAQAKRVLLRAGDDGEVALEEDQQQQVSADVLRKIAARYQLDVDQLLGEFGRQ
jgi:hypothetical protein